MVPSNPHSHGLILVGSGIFPSLRPAESTTGFEIKSTGSGGPFHPAPRGEKFKDVASAYMKNIAPHLSPSTARQRTSHLRAHLLPRFGDSSLMAMDIQTLQCFTTELLSRLSRKSILNVLGTLFAVLGYAKRCGIRVSDASLGSVKLGGDREGTEAKYFKRNAAHQIIQQAREPYRTIFALAWATGMRAGELLGLRIGDLDFDRKFIQPRTQADDRTRELRGLKTPKSKDVIPMTSETVAMLRDYLKNHWKDNPQGIPVPQPSRQALQASQRCEVRTVANSKAAWAPDSRVWSACISARAGDSPG